MTPDVGQKIDQFFSQYPRRTYPKGQILIFAEESPEHIYHLISGKVRKYSISYRGDEVIVNLFKPPAFFPMSWAINKVENKFFYKTEVKTELNVVPSDAVVNFLKDNPDVMLDLLSRIYRGLEGILGEMVQLMSGTAQSRLIYELLIEAKRFGVKEDGTYLLEINEVDLAARAGLSRETVSREIQKLKDRGMVSLSSKQIVINKFVALEKMLGED
jgi:CRP-like cAMP-binding protein